jgi:hypothetical protein
LLAHAYLTDARSVARTLLANGDALRVTVPPNTWNYRCYARAEDSARQARRGVWQFRRYRGVPASQLPDGVAGFRVVQGHIARVGESKDAYWLELEGLTLRLAKADLGYFSDVQPRSRVGARLRVRGWIYRVHGRARMNLRHPASAEWLDE